MLYTSCNIKIMIQKHLIQNQRLSQCCWYIWDNECVLSLSLPPPPSFLLFFRISSFANTFFYIFYANLLFISWFTHFWLKETGSFKMCVHLVPKHTTIYFAFCPQHILLCHTWTGKPFLHAWRSLVLVGLKEVWSFLGLEITCF